MRFSLNLSINQREKIAKADQLTYLWVLGASLLVGVIIAVGVVLVKDIVFGERILKSKNDTATTLERNIATVPKLLDGIRVLNTNEGLRSVQIDSNGRAVQSVLDALPTNPNVTALGASLQTKLLKVEGVTIESIKIDSPEPGFQIDGEIGLSFNVSVGSGSPDTLNNVLRRIEASIRPINITSMSIERQGSRLVLAATGYASYQSPTNANLKEEELLK